MEYIQFFGFQTQEEFFEWMRKGQRREDFPGDPYGYYSSRGVWPKGGWPEFLGYGPRTKMSVEKAMDYIQVFDFQSPVKFREWLKIGPVRADFPRNPQTYYMHRGVWPGWPVFLGYKPRRVNILRKI